MPNDKHFSYPPILTKLLFTAKFLLSDKSILFGGRGINHLLHNLDAET